MRFHYFARGRMLFFARGGRRPTTCSGACRTPPHDVIDHQVCRRWLAAIRELTHGYQPPADACATYRLVLEELQAFETDLHAHVHLENHVLFPKAVELESKVEHTTRGLKSQRWE